MLPVIALSPKPGEKILDMCAAPGSKTTLINEMLKNSNDSCLVANDVDLERACMLMHQMRRDPSSTVVVTQSAAQYFPGLNVEGEKLMFDKILADVPCGGDGTIRKNPDIWKKWDCKNSIPMHKLQFKILKRGIGMLKCGGLMLYSTCSLNPLEDEAVITELFRQCSKNSVEILDIHSLLPDFKFGKGLKSWDISIFESACKGKELEKSFHPPNSEIGLEKCARVWPHENDTGGFFMALLRKNQPIYFRSQKEIDEQEFPLCEREGRESCMKSFISQSQSFPLVKPALPKKHRFLSQTEFDDLKNYFGLNENLILEQFPVAGDKVLFISNGAADILKGFGCFANAIVNFGSKAFHIKLEEKPFLGTAFHPFLEFSTQLFNISSKRKILVSRLSFANLAKSMEIKHENFEFLKNCEIGHLLVYCETAFGIFEALFLVNYAESAKIHGKKIYLDRINLRFSI